VSASRPYLTLDSRYVWQSRWYSLRQDHLRAADGSEITYTVVEKPGAVWIVPVTADGQMVLIRQYRHPVEAWCLEVPAGNVEPGHDELSMAARELREEVGGTAGRWAKAAEFFTMNGIGNEIAQVYLAQDVTLGAPQREPTEYIDVELLPVAEALRLARAGAIKDGPSALAILLCEPLLGEYGVGPNA